MSAEKFVTLDQAAEHFQVHRRTLERFIQKRQIRAHRLGRCVRVKLSEIEADLIPMGATPYVPKNRR